MIGDQRVTIADFSHLPVTLPFIAMVPQWDFLDFLARLRTPLSDVPAADAREVFELIERDGRVAGVRARTPEGAVDVHADLVVGADGRTSTVRTSRACQ